MVAANDGEDWVANLRSVGDVQAAAIAKLNKFLVGGLLRSFSGKGVDAAFCEDIAQEAIVKILNKLDQFEGRSRFTTWAMSIAIRGAVSELRKKRYQNVSLNQLSDGEQLQIEIPDDSAEQPEQLDERRNVVLKLKELIESKLSDKQRVALQGGLSGMTVDEVALHTGSNRNAVYKLVHDARQKLKRELEQAGYDGPTIQSLFS
ncbi:MAG: sigma-70 family RNA polymerase sigma factor [Planctomycetota bacterium]